MLEQKERNDIREIADIMLHLDDTGRRTMLISGRTLMARQDVEMQMKRGEKNIILETSVCEAR